MTWKFIFLQLLPHLRSPQTCTEKNRLYFIYISADYDQEYEKKKQICALGKGNFSSEDLNKIRFFAASTHRSHCDISCRNAASCDPRAIPSPPGFPFPSRFSPSFSEHRLSTLNILLICPLHADAREKFLYDTKLRFPV